MTFTLIMPDDLSAVKTTMVDYAYSINTIWVLLTAALVFFLTSTYFQITKLKA